VRVRASARFASALRLAAGFVLWLGASACLELSPFETDLDEHESALTEKQLTRLGSSQPVGSYAFALISDSHEHFATLRSLVDVFNARDDLAFVAHLGDMTNMGLRREFRGALDQLEALRVPFLTLVGNHDVLTYGRDIYRSMFGPFDYAFTHGGIRFVCFNANTLEFPGEMVPNLAWLRHESAPDRDPDVAGVIVLSHQPLEQSKYLQILGENAVLATFGAHVHRFHIKRKEGVLSVTSGAANAGEWVLVRVAGTELRVSQCSGSVCTPRSAP
jgi:Icc protein